MLRVMLARGMQMWLVLTRVSADVRVHVNMQLVTHLWRVQPDATEIAFSKSSALLVKEPPEEILARLSPSEPRPFSG